MILPIEYSGSDHRAVELCASSINSLKNENNDRVTEAMVTGLCHLTLRCAIQSLGLFLQRYVLSFCFSLSHPQYQASISCFQEFLFHLHVSSCLPYSLSICHVCFSVVYLLKSYLPSILSHISVVYLISSIRDHCIRKPGHLCNLLKYEVLSTLTLWDTLRERRSLYP